MHPMEGFVPYNSLCRVDESMGMHHPLGSENLSTRRCQVQLICLAPFMLEPMALQWISLLSQTGIHMDNTGL